MAPPEWAKAAEDVRTTIKWLVGALGAVGAFLFAKGLVTTPDLNWTDDKNNLIGAWFLGAVAILGLGWLIHEAIEVLRPTVYELGDLPPAYKKEINEAPLFYLPAGTTSIDEFIDAYRELRAQEAAARKAVKAAKAAVEKAKDESPVDEQKVRAAEALRGSAESAQTGVTEVLAMYVEIRETLIDRAAYWTPARGFENASATIVIAAAVAAFGGVGYQLALAPSGGDDSDSAADSTAGPYIATMTRVEGEAGDALWDMFDLEGCQSRDSTEAGGAAEADASAVIDVVVSSGKGTSADPYVVSTIPAEGCLPRTFTVINEVALVGELPVTAITYSPSPTATPSDEQSPEYPPRP